MQMIERSPWLQPTDPIEGVIEHNLILRKSSSHEVDVRRADLHRRRVCAITIEFVILKPSAPAELRIP